MEVLNILNLVRTGKMKRRLVTTYGDDDRSGVQEDVFFFRQLVAVGASI